MKIIIKRYGRYINEVPEGEIERWIKDNVTDVRGHCIYENAGLDRCYEIAGQKGYTFEITK